MYLFIYLSNFFRGDQFASVPSIEINIKTYWAKRVLNKLNMLGLGYFGNNAYISLKYFPIIKQRIRDIYIHQWRQDYPNH